MQGPIRNPLKKGTTYNHGYLGMINFALILMVWSALAYSGLVSNIFLPTPVQVIETAYQMISDPAGDNLLHHAFISTARVAVGFCLSAIFAVPLGMFMGRLSSVRAFFEPLMGAVRYMPASAFIPLFILWIGLGEAEKITVIFWGTFFQQTLMVMDVAKNVSGELVEVSYTLGAKQLNTFKKVILPASLPGIIDTLRISFGWAWTYLIVAELVGANSGLGYVIIQAGRFLHTDVIFVGILVIGLLGMFTDLFFKILYRVMFPWLTKEGT